MCFQERLKAAGLPSTGLVSTKESAAAPKPAPLPLSPEEIEKKWKEDEEAASQLLISKILQEEKQKREQATANKKFLCPICFTDYPAEQIYILDHCFHRYCAGVRSNT